LPPRPHRTLKIPVGFKVMPAKTLLCPVVTPLFSVLQHT
jgi:hypothetical protein